MQPDSRLGWNEVFDPAKSGWDSIVPFLGVAQMLAAEATTVLDVGCGRGAAAENSADRVFHDLRGAGRHVIGIDLDPIGEKNPLLDEFRLIDTSRRWPLQDSSVDLAVSDFTLEHVDDPPEFVAELDRVLRPGGAFVARTISRHSPLALAARAVPNERHTSVLSVLQPKRQDRDVFPTRYRMNTDKHLHALFDPAFDLAIAHRGGIEQYFLRWPRVARAAAVIEPRMPKVTQITLVVYARKR